jgi:hypothetical protein
MVVVNPKVATKKIIIKRPYFGIIQEEEEEEEEKEEKDHRRPEFISRAFILVSLQYSLIVYLISNSV